MIECVIFGGLLLDKYLKISQLPIRGQDGFITDEFNLIGGCSINMAATFNNLGGTAHIVSYVGDDQTGEQILSYIYKHDFSTKYIKQKFGNTGYCLVLLEPDGERTFLTKTGMELDFSKDIIGDDLKGIDYAAVTGYFLLNKSANKIMDVLEDFSKRGGYILFDPSPLVNEIDNEILSRVLEISNIITPNASELVSITKDKNITMDQWIDEFIQSDKIIIKKEGNRGGTVFQKSGNFNYEAILTEPVDTTGAGDSFSAGILYGLAMGLSMKQAVSLGSHTAAVSVGINGPHGFWEPNTSIKEILSNNHCDGGKSFE